MTTIAGDSRALSVPAAGLAGTERKFSGQQVLMLVLNPFTNDARVSKEAKSLVDSGLRVTVFALHEADLPESEFLDGTDVRRFRLRTRSWSKRRPVQLVKFIECASRMIATGTRQRPWVVHAHDVNTLPIGAAIAKLSGASLFYDSHELWADNIHQLQFPRWVCNAVNWGEGLLARRAASVFTVCDSIAEHMSRGLGIARPSVIRNLPSPVEKEPWQACASHRLRTALGIASEVPIALYQGLIGPMRGLETLIRAMASVPPPAVAVLLGNGPDIYVQALREQISSLGLSSRVLMHPAVPLTSLFEYTSDATIGISAAEDVCLSQRYCLPNKLFEYLQAGLPVLITDLPEMAAIVRAHGVGRTFPSGNSQQMAAALREMLQDHTDLSAMRRRAHSASTELHWGKEQRVLLDAYSRLQERGAPIGVGVSGP